jgi:cytochrome c oxidase subunit II
VNKFWGIVFAVVMAACGLSFVVAPWMGWWLPEGVSTHAREVDDLFYVILYITGFFFFLTEAILVAFLFLYSGEPGVAKPQRARGVPPLLSSMGGVLGDPHRIEMLWTLIPAIILLYIAFAQIGVWAEVKYQKNTEFGKPDGDKTYVPNQIDVSARQFEWRIRYPSHERFTKWLKADKADAADFASFAKIQQADDIHVVNELHTWVGEPTFVFLTTKDVIHSFNIPVMRVKQDALPGKVIPVWFVPTQANTAKIGDTFVDGMRFKGTLDPKDPKQRIYVYKQDATGKYDYEKEPANVWDLPCAELCGWGHYRMIGRVYVHPSQEQFVEWLDKVDKESRARTGSR